MKRRIANVAIIVATSFGAGFAFKEFKEIEIFKFLNSSFFVALTTAIVGSFAIFLYKKQQWDSKKDAAELILQEIRYAEQQIRNAKKNEYAYYLADKLLPTNSWHKNIHLFVKDLKETEIDIISQFYSHSAYLDIVIRKISDKKNDFLVPVNTSNNSIASGVPQEFGLNANKILKEVSETIDLIYNTPAIDKLRSIADGEF